MKATSLFAGIAALVLVGCASDHDRYSEAYHQRYYVAEEHPVDRVIIDRDGHRTYVREFDERRGSPDFQNNMEPRVRGKHVESLGWTRDNYYLQRGY